MKTAFLILFFIFYQSLSFGGNLIIKTVEEGVNGSKELKIPLPAKEQIVWDKNEWKCKAMSIAHDWGTFRCDTAEGLEVSTRFDCKRHKTFEDSQSFRIAKKKSINITFSLWCE
ncbi:MAG: hypothetical protein ACXVCE_11190 [Bacteriovorax sp.]